MEKKVSEIIASKVSNPFITIAIPTYKRDALLIEAIESALNQDCNCLYDVIVVDNNPERDDITERAMRRYLSHDRVSYYKNAENIGPIGNWNRLYDFAKGEYVVMLHDDDMLFPNYLKVVTAFLKATNYEYHLVYPSYHFSSDRQFPNAVRPSVVKYRKMGVEDYLVTQWGLPSGLFIKKDDFHRIGGYIDKYYPINDQEFIYRSLHHVKGACIYLPIVFYYMGVNTSMRPDIIIASLVEAVKFNDSIHKDKDNKWRFLAPFLLRAQIKNQILWGSRFVTQDVIDEGRKTIGISANFVLDKSSRLLRLLLLGYVFLFKIDSFRIND